MAGTGDLGGWEDKMGFEMTSPPDPRTRHVRPAWGYYYHPFVLMAESLCQNICQEGNWGKCIQVPRQAQCIHSPCFGIRDGGHKLRQFAIVPRRKQVHLGKMPFVTDLSKDIRVKRPFRLNNLTVLRQFVGYHIEPARISLRLHQDRSPMRQATQLVLPEVKLKGPHVKAFLWDHFLQ